MRYLFFVLALLAGISSAIAPASAEGGGPPGGPAGGGCGGEGHCCYQGGNDNSQGNEDCQ
jgi:hypothetical protein